ncbi:ABC transporter permease [Alloacidobacterium dinghuense]|uniref:ABC transporter permease n=1 Tax=Alloacidobacterium dinghuense TaxID=2763107 RepID=A0A7G8BI33_9BACT|nr:ABC transporter permease [Alloacidobacterium dinghuense]QNI32203.1 ABC transporter permease [Alloacidobacterium dinghuense]
MLADLRDALRQLRKAPGFTATAVITLALGIGATTAIFTLVHQVLLKSLPVTKPDELWRIGDLDRCCNWGGYVQGDDGDFSLFSWEAYKNFRAHTPEFSDLAALQAGNAPLGVRREGSQAPVDTRNGEYVSGNFFRTLGIQPWIGRLMTDEDDKEGAPSVAVMSYHIWSQKYGSDPSVVGASYQINGHPFTVIGVTPPGFYGGRLSGFNMPDLWLPLTTELLIDGATARLKRPNGNFLDLLGRVHPGVNPKTLEAKLRVEFHDWLASHVPDMEPGEKQLWQQQTLHLVPGGAGVASMKAQYEDGLRLLLIASTCVLLVACGNLANLMLARGLKDRAQTSVRVALGASRQRLVRKALVECVLLAVIGGVIGIAVAYAGTRLILHLAFQIGGPNNYVPIDASPSWPVLLFTLGVSVLTGILFGIAPAWMTSHAEPVEALRGANRSVGGGRSWAQKSLVIGQAAMSLILLSAAALLGQSLRNLQHQNFGFDMRGRYIAWINPLLSNYKPEQMEPMFREIDARLRQIPGVRMVAPALYAPMSGDSWNDGIRIEGRPEPGAKEDTSAGWSRVMPGFFETIGAKVVLGRPITEDDTDATRKIAVINEAFAKKFFKGENPIGQHFGPDKIKYSATYEIVGVIRNIRYMTYDYKEAIRPMFWVPEAQTVQYDETAYMSGEIWSHYLYNIVIWAPGNPPGLEERVRKVLAGVDPNFVLYGVDPYSKVVDADFQQQNMIATLTTLFGILGLVLAAVGLYGVMAYTVEQRTSEIGVRMALGADRGQVVKMVLRGAFSQIAIGLAIGIPTAIGVGKLMTDQLFGVKPWDPVMLTLATLLLALAALLATVIPARRAAGVEPIVALRNE